MSVYTNTQGDIAGGNYWNVWYSVKLKQLHILNGVYVRSTDLDG